MDMNAYLSMFIDESNDHLQALNDNLMRLESDPEDISIVQDIFRSAHTLKGMSATMGYEDLASLTHEMENVLDLVRNHKLKMDSFIFDTLFKGLDALETMVQNVEEGGTGKADVSAIVSDLVKIVKGDYNVAGEAGSINSAQSSSVNSSDSNSLLDQFQTSVLKQSIESGHQVFYVKVTLTESCVLKAARSYMVFDVLENAGEIVKTEPSVEALEQEKFDRSFTVFIISQISSEEIIAKINNISEIENVEVSVLDEVSLSALSYSDTSTNNKVTTESTEVTASKSEVQVARKDEKKNVKQSSQVAVANRTIRVDIDRLDSLMNLFSEMLIDRVRLEQLASEIKRSDLSETIEHMARVSSDLQNIVLKLRMVPVDTVFNRFPRMIRDIAKSMDKKIDLIITGAETEIDRTVIDEIGDPLVHLLRNSADHGIETVSERIAAGKPETGTVHLRAFHSGNHVFIEVEEDGKGINKEKVLEKAISKGVVRPEDASKLSDDEINMLIFSAGFSTADVISDISGRGVGLDVVRTKITSLGGNVSVTSVQGKGTKFSVQLPLTLSIISAMLIKLGDEKYAVPLSSIVETAIIQKSSILSVHGNVMIKFRSAVIPLISLSKLFDSTSFDEQLEDEHEIIVIQKGEKWAAILIDEFIGQSEIVLKSLGQYMKNITGISGATILGDGQVALIIDPNALIK